MATASERFAAVIAAFDDEPDVRLSEARGFSRGGLMRGGKLIATLRGERLLLKLPAARVQALIATGVGAAFDANKGRPMKEWVTVGPEADWPGLAREAAAFAG
ncbi:MAG: TfoX/Sxy family protein [Phenylobacterium sp.]|nr:TfoX/Sxy family protein [Phenylobacterium sp.]MDB5494953.1 TfoX/Sxy family protein [Phenylobacterium sp.]